MSDGKNHKIGVGRICNMVEAINGAVAATFGLEPSNFRSRVPRLGVPLRLRFGEAEA